MSVTITTEALVLDRRFSNEEYERYQTLIDGLRQGGGYYHRIVIEDAARKRLETPGSHPCLGVIAVLDRHGFPHDLRGRTVLDIGCNTGFYSFVAKLRGARSVLGIDHSQHYIDQALLAREILGLDVEFRCSEGHDLDERFGRFDFVINTGVIYHLQNPMDFLCRVSQVTLDTMYLESEMLTDPSLTEYAWFIEGEYGQDPSNWWIYGPKCVERMVRAAGFLQAEFQGMIWTPPPGIRTPEGFERQGRGAFVCRK
jgi:2-polyprenyl-3-methyl-5-hydroxy-6-metoxy-1,4-benzoquinol methylase